jgi:MiaB/RimO family radical SAM methylthiotransferase
VIPQVRGASRSRSAAAVLAEARRRAAQGHRELVLTGVNLGCFRDREAGLDLAGLLEAVAAVEGVERVRLSSIEVNHLSDRLLRAVADTPGVARHLHVPMQSGSDRVLRAMRRHYAAAGFLGRMHRARELVDGINLTSDVIVGHPSERVDDFGATLDAVSAAGFTKVHVFPYSPRPGTADAGDDPVTLAEKRRRSRQLRALSDAHAAAHRASKVGRRERVLVEDADGRGYSDDYTPFRVTGGVRGRLAEVLGVLAAGDAVIATLCS